MLCITLLLSSAEEERGKERGRERELEREGRGVPGRGEGEKGKETSRKKRKGKGGLEKRGVWRREEEYSSSIVFKNNGEKERGRRELLCPGRKPEVSNVATTTKEARNV